MSPTAVISPSVKWPIRPLASVVERLFVGLPVSRHIAKPGDESITVWVLSVGDIEDGQIAPSNRLPKVNLRAGNFDRFRVQPGDVLVSCRGTVLKAAPVFDGAQDLFTSSNIITIRIMRSLVAPQIILSLLRSSAWREVLESRTRSSTGLMQLTIKDLEDLPVPMPPHDIQAKLVDLIDTGERTYRIALEAATARRALGETLIDHTLLGRTQGIR
jgi:restriction endonuclease S subunit